MFPIRRTGALIGLFAPRTGALNAWRFSVFLQNAGLGRHIINDPVNPHLVFSNEGRNIGVVHNEDKGVGFGRDIFNL
jgi:hypothetical protein